MTPDKSDRILVESQYLARCKWCGTPNSPRWITLDGGIFYCSEECQRATTTTSTKYLGIGMLVLGVSMLLVSFPLLVSGPWILIYGAMLTLMGFCTYDRGKEGEQYLNRKDLYRDVQLLVCDYCSYVNPPSVLKCHNCGATIESADFAADSWPEWFSRTPVPYKGIAYPNCSAIYTYDSSKKDDEGRVICQNCTEVFHVSAGDVD